MKIYSHGTKHLLAVDCIIFGYDIVEKEIKLLLFKRLIEPAKGKWSLAGGFVEANESLDDAASRILWKITGLESVYLKQSYSFGDVDRDPGDRVISVAYFVDISDVVSIGCSSFKSFIKVFSVSSTPSPSNEESSSLLVPALRHSCRSTVSSQVIACKIL